MTTLARDVRFAWRTLLKNPVFTAVSILTLALGIGANSAIFSLIHAALLRPLPFPEPDRLAFIWEETSMFGLKDSPVALGNYQDWRARNSVFAEMGALEPSSFRLTGAGEPRQVQGYLVTAGALRTLGVKPILGRWFRDDEDRNGAPRTAVVSYGLWKSALAGDRAAVGRALEINDEKYTLVGVMPPAFRFPGSDTELWTPLGAVFSPVDMDNHGRHNAMVVGRLKPGMTLARANEEIRNIAAGQQKERPRTNGGVSAFVAPLRDHFISDVRPTLRALAGAVGFVLLIACANIANLLLSRASNRTREIAVRAAIGGGRWQIARQLLTENLMLAAAGGALGLVGAAAGARLLEKLLPEAIVSMSPVAVDGAVLAFTLGISALTALLFGLAPLLQLFRVDLNQLLKQGGARHGIRSGSRRTQRALVIAEVALAFVLVTGAALAIQGFVRLRSVNPGFETRNILTLKTLLAARQYRDPARRQAFYDETLRRVKVLPGVESAGFTLGAPVVFKGWVNGIIVEGRPLPAIGQFANANYRVVTPDYMQTIGAPLRAGRYLSDYDGPKAPRVALINETMKRQFWPGEEALGKRFRMSSGAPWITVAGVVGDFHQSGLDVAPKPETYLPVAQETTPISGLVIRTHGDPEALAAAVRREIHAVDRGVPITDVRSMEQVLDREVFQRRGQTTLIAAFAICALLLAALGVYGVLAYLVARRTQEIGVRVALGARPLDVLMTVAGQGLALSAVGIALGAAVSVVVTRALSKLLFGVSPRDPATLAGVAALLLLTAAAASYLPARRAMRVDPVVALREE